MTHNVSADDVCFFGTWLSSKSSFSPLILPGIVQPECASCYQSDGEDGGGGITSRRRHTGTRGQCVLDEDS